MAHDLHSFEFCNRYELFVTGSDYDYEPHLVIICEAKFNRDSGGIITFRAEERGVFIDPALPAEILWMHYAKRLAPQAVFYAAKLEEGEHSHLAPYVSGLARGEFAGASAENAVTLLYEQLALSNPECSFLKNLGNKKLLAMHELITEFAATSGI
jgi:hypothetical protein